MGFLGSNRMSGGLCRLLWTDSNRASGLLLFQLNDTPLSTVLDISMSICRSLVKYYPYDDVFLE